MTIFNSISDFKSPKKTILTLGTFDGVHIGHKKILDKIIQEAAEGDFESVVLTFFPHPRMVLQDNSDIKLLNTIDEKVVLLQNLGIQNLVIHPFDTAFSKLSAHDFVKTVLVDQFQIHKIIIGYDHRFGANRTASIDDLILYGQQFGFQVAQISVQEINDVSISSTKIRNALQDGNMQLAKNYLNYNYLLTGKVVEGKKLGRTLGFPTANIQIAETYKLIPKNGVYVIKSLIDNKTVFGMMNIGFNPTFGGQKQSIEVHFFDFDANLYHQKISISILHHLRLEQKFESIDALKNQLKADKKAALDYILSL